jgi:enoyl-[acyl-carrier protein] reductase I
MLISVYSFTAVAQRAEALMTDGGSMLTLTYYGAEKVMPHYNVMGVAKAALEASVRYLAVDLGGSKPSASTPSPPARSRRWRPRASAISATS